MSEILNELSDFMNEYRIDYPEDEVQYGHLAFHRGILVRNSDDIPVQYRVYFSTVWSLLTQGGEVDRIKASSFIREFEVILKEHLDCKVGFATSSGIIYLQNPEDFDNVLDVIKQVLTLKKLAS